MASRHELSMDSYDRLFPSQNTMPRGGFGNLIALPLQHGPRQEGNAVFLDESLNAYRAIGYARGEAPLGYGEPKEEYDDDVLRGFDHESATDRGEDFAEV
ncbi:MAG TPA: hypothetical protein VK745_06420 [Polyangiaceae bacterium]|nr:hypothetical protein [Polyangiaceae bacterium]